MLGGRRREMIIGIGNDLVDIRRVERTLGRFGDRFLAHVFTDLEKEKAQRRPNPAAALAQRFAAKEACSKALGTGFRQGVYWRDIGVDNHPSGKPFLTLTGGARKRLDSLTPEGMMAQIDVTLTDEYPLANAVVIISAVAANE
jgi:holo-[acyl-carrier protein] synthase